MGDIILKPGREKPVHRRHPWVFSGAVGEVRGQPGDGDTVEIYAATGDFLARGAFSPNSQIRARIWTWDQAEPIDRSFFRTRLEQAIAARQGDFDLSKTNAYRLVHAESDGLPGLVVDRYNDLLVVQFLSSGADHWRSILTDLLQELTGIKTLYERSDVEVRSLEGLPSRTGLLMRGARGREFRDPGKRVEILGGRSARTKDRFLPGSAAKPRACPRVCRGEICLKLFCLYRGICCGCPGRGRDRRALG